MEGVGAGGDEQGLSNRHREQAYTAVAELCLGRHSFAALSCLSDGCGESLEVLDGGRTANNVGGGL